MKILVFGSNGFVGKVVTKRAQAIGIEVAQASSSLGSGLDAETGLLRTGFTLPRDTRAVIYLSQSPRSAEGAKGAPHTMAVNTFTPLQVATMAAAANVERFVYVSTATVYGPSFGPLDETSPLRRDSWYTLSKVHAEESLDLLRHHLDITVVRPFAIYGPCQSGRLVPKLIEGIRQQRTITLQPSVSQNSNAEVGGLRISLCHVDDAADALLHFATKGGPPCVNMASSEAFSIREIAEAISRHLGMHPVFYVESKHRTYDMLANTELLTKCCPLVFRSFSASIRSILEESSEPDGLSIVRSA